MSKTHIFKLEFEEFTKKEIKTLIFSIILSFIIGLSLGDYINLKFLHNTNPAIERDFEFRGGFSHNGGGYETCISHVVVNNYDYTDDEMLSLIYEKFKLMNGEPDELTLNLYYSVDALHRDDPYLTKTYIKE